MKFVISTAYHKDFEYIRRLYNLPEVKFFGPSIRKVLNAKVFFQNNVSHRLIIREDESYFSIIGYAEFNIYPQIHPLPRACWNDWFHFHYCTQMPVSKSNTMFFESFMYHEKYVPALLLAVLHEFFLMETKARFLITVEPPDYRYESPKDKPDYHVLQHYCEIFYPAVFGIDNCTNTQRIHVISRDKIWANMRYRKALPEDNDDVVELLDMDFPHLRKEWGDFYIAEQLLLKENEESHNALIVAEVNNSTVGFLWLNDHVDVLRMVKYFEVEIFDNLIKYSPDEPYKVREILVRHLKRRKDFFAPKTIRSLFEAPQSDDDNVIAPILKGEMSAFTLTSIHRLSSYGNDSSSGSSGRMCPYDNIYYKFSVVNEALRGTHHYLVEVTNELLFRYNPIDLTARSVARVEHFNENSFAANVHTSKQEDIEKDYPPDFNSNVFALQLFGMSLDLDKRRAFQFLISAFSAYPDRDFCMLSIERTLSINDKMEEMLKYFVHVVPRPNCPIDDDIYITHRSTVCGDLSLNHVRPEDLPDIKNILESGYASYYLAPSFSTSTAASQRISAASALGSEVSTSSDLTPEMEYIESIMFRVYDTVMQDPFSDYSFYTIRCGNSAKPLHENVIVGFIILRQFVEIDALYKYFKVHLDTEKPSFSAAEVVMLKLNPLLSYQSDMLFRELARLTGSFDIFYFCPIKASTIPLPNDLVVNMQPIEPHAFRTIHYTKVKARRRKKSIIDEIEHLDYHSGNFAVFQQNLHPSKFSSNREKIVIYGFNDECLAFLRLLIFMWNDKKDPNWKIRCCLPRLNVVSICKPGVMAAEYDKSFSCEYCDNVNSCWVSFQECNAYLRDITQRMDLRYYVNFVRARIKDINRNKKVVVLSNSCEITYGSLLLCCSTTFCIPKPMHSNTELPPNYAHFNSRLERIIFYYKIQLLLKEAADPNSLRILVYGGHLRTYSFINFLVTHGVAPHCITLVTPFEPIDQDLNINIPYNDANIEMILQEMTTDLGVNLMPRLRFVYWMRYYEDDNLSDVVFEDFPDRKEVTIPCDFFISFYEFSNDLRFVEVLKRASIAVDREKIIVDKDFRTNDPNIYALGNYVKRNVEPNHQYTHVSPIEIGQKMMHILGLKIDLNYEEKFSWPCYFRCQLPMGYFIAKVCIPKRYLANHLSNTYSHTMTTYDDGTFVRVRLNDFDIVEEITCVSSKKTCLDHLQHFCGKHEALLNNMTARYKKNEFTSFLHYFAEPWGELIMNENFADLHETNVELIRPHAENLLHSNFDRSERKEIIPHYITHETLEAKFLTFLRKHRGEFHEQFIIPEDYEELR